MKIKGYEDEDGTTSIPIDKDGKIRPDIEIAEIEGFKKKKFFNSYGRAIDLKRKYDYETEKLITWLPDNKYYQGAMSVYRVTNKDTGRRTIKFVTNNAEGDEIQLVYSDKKALKIGKDIYNFFVFNGNPEELIEEYPQISSESKVYGLLLNSPNYTVMTSDLIDSGFKYITAVKILKSMERRGILCVDGKHGNHKVYTSVIPRDHLKIIFSFRGIDLDKELKVLQSDIDEFYGQLWNMIYPNDISSPGSSEQILTLLTNRLHDKNHEITELRKLNEKNRQEYEKEITELDDGWKEAFKEFTEKM